MVTEKKNFIKKNEEFVCENCKKKNEKHATSCRNHCKYCLYSKHVDKDIPGDRNSKCKGLMKPIAIEKKNETFIILHECEKCKKTIRNTAADDDDFETIINISTSVWNKESFQS